MFGIVEKIDEEIVDETDKNSDQVIDLEKEFWRLICKYQRKADFLHCVEYDKETGENTSYDLLMMLANFEVLYIQRIKKDIQCMTNLTKGACHDRKNHDFCPP